MPLTKAPPFSSAPDLDTRRDQEVFPGTARPITEAGQLTIDVQRAHRYGAAARLRTGGENGRKDRIDATFVAGGEHEDASSSDRALQGVAQGTVKRAGTAQAVVDHVRALIDSVVGRCRDVRLIERAGARTRARRVRPHHEKPGTERHTVAQSAVAPRANDPGDRGAMAVHIAKIAALPVTISMAAGVDRAGELGMVEVDPGFDDTDHDAVPSGSGGVCGRRLNPVESPVREVFGSLEEARWCGSSIPNRRRHRRSRPRSSRRAPRRRTQGRAEPNTGAGNQPQSHSRRVRLSTSD